VKIMGVTVKSVVLVCTVLLLGLAFGSFVSSDAASASPQVITTTVKYDYYVVAGYEMEPTLPNPAPSPYGFNFTCNPPVYNFGNITYWGGRTYLKEGTSDSPTGGAYVEVNITNLLGYDITITNLTAQVTDGTPTLHFYFSPAEDWFGNFTLLQIDSLDPWPKDEPFVFDEVDYYTGEVEPLATPDGDWATGAVGIPYPEGQFYTGQESLLEPDYEGDAEATGHVAPIPLAAGETFTEYFGVIIFGDATSGAQINGTITLRLTYEYEAPSGYPVPSFTYTPTDPIFNEAVTFNASASYHPNGTIETYTWDFGDGTSGTGKIVNHTYTAQGIYTVVLNVTDSEGLWLTASKFVRVTAVAAPPPAEFPWLWVGVGVVVVIVVVAAVVVLRRRK
jgi:hypothetical protein